MWVGGSFIGIGNRKGAGFTTYT